MAKNNGIVRRIDIDLDKVLKEIAEKNEISLKQASKELAKGYGNIKGVKVQKEIKF